MAPAAGGNASGLSVACTIANADINPTVTIKDYNDGEWHYGAARSVMVQAKRTGASPGVPGGTTIQFCPNNPGTVGIACNGYAAPIDPVGNLALSAADVNHSIEFPTSSPTLTNVMIAAGSFVVCVGAACVPALPANQAKLSKAIVNSAAPNAWGACAPFANPCFTPPVSVLVSNDRGRQVTDGSTTAGSLCVGSVAANFKAADVGMRISGGDIPDNTTIDAVPGTCAANQAHTVCAGCAPGTAVTTAGSQVISLAPSIAPTSSRYVTDGSSGANKILSSATAEFAPSDIGLPVSFVPPVAGTVALGARISAVATDGSTATLTEPGNLPSGPKKFVVGKATKTAPATSDAVATLAIQLTVNPSVSPTSPPCAAGKISGFQIPLSWRNPEGTAVAPPTNVIPAKGYNTFVGGTHLSGVSPAGTSVAQLDFRTASTSFSGYVEQLYTTTAGVQGGSSYKVAYTFLPVGVGVCPLTDLAAQWNFFGLSKKIVENPSFTGGGGGGVRGIKPEVQGGSTTYTGASGATFTSGATALPMSNSCTVSSPPPVQPGC